MADVARPIEADDLWQAFLADVGPQLSNHVLDTWLRPVRCVAITNGRVTLQVRDQFFRDWLVDHYLDFISTKLSEKLGHAVAIDWALNPGEPELAAPSTPERTTSTGTRLTAIRTQPGSAADTNTGVDDEDVGTVSESMQNGKARRALNQRYKFGNFVAGPSNQFAFAAAKAVAENPGTSYNPLFLFGGVGLGKTHLLTAVAHQILEDQPRARVVYASAEQFTNEVINAVLGSKLQEFRTKYRNNCDVLLIDDIQLIAGKDRTQHEFFHVFNTLHDSQRQIVVTSDKLPHEIPDIEDRLRNRFQWGLIADIQPPEIETRIAILRKKAETEGIALSSDVTFFLAREIRSNVRELEGALVRLLAHASMTHNAITVDYARDVLTDIVNNRASQVSVESIQKLVAAYFQVRVSDINSRRRLKTLVRPRQIAMYLCRKHTGSSYPDLGSRFGNKDHTTIMNACNKVETQLKSDPSLRGQVLEIERQLDVASSA